MADFYDWNKTLSYDADVTMVIGAKGIGKTFGLRKQCIKDFLRDGSRKEGMGEARRAELDRDYNGV